jgi:hypothetical protein
MKFSKEHFEGLKSAIINSDTDIAATKAAYKEKGLSDQRFYWDIFWASQYHKNESFRNSDYYDTHIETAIKAAIKEILI